VTALIFIFRRSSNDLIMRMNIELVEALCGFQRVIKTLDGRDLVITAIPGELSYEKDNPCMCAARMMCIATEQIM
jgi:DnaJ family protein A protein 1